MHMTPKALLIPIAAFAVTVTGVQAFDPEILKDAGLTDTQVEAFVEARELREIGEREKAREVLVAAGVDMETMEKVREAMHEERKASHEAMEAALETEDFAAFKIAIADSPIADIITTEEDFALFKEAHTLREDGDMEGARALMDELGFEPKEFTGHMGIKAGKIGGALFNALSDEQKEALRVAHENKDREAVAAILEAAGIETSSRGIGVGHGIHHEDEDVDDN